MRLDAVVLMVASVALRDDGNDGCGARRRGGHGGALGLGWLTPKQALLGEPMGQRDARDQGEKDGQGGASEYPRGNLFGRVAVVGF